MLFTVSEVSKLTSLSKVSIYKKLKLKELESFITKNQGITYIDEGGLSLIKEGIFFDENELKKFQASTDKPLKDIEFQAFKDDLSIKNDYLNYLKMENERLWTELQERNTQINNLTRLNENSQVLLKDKLNPNILLEEHCQGVEVKIKDAKERMVERNQEENKKKGFLSKFFGV